MIQKEDFYHGAAIIQLLEDSRCEKLTKKGPGYVANDQIFLFFKYRTKSRSPWQFAFSEEEINKVNSLVSNHERVILALICGGDGVCAVAWEEAWRLFGSNKGGWLCVRRNFNECYEVSGPEGTLNKKVSKKGWPLIVVENAVRPKNCACNESTTTHS